MDYYNFMRERKMKIKDIKYRFFYMKSLALDIFNDTCKTSIKCRITRI